MYPCALEQRHDLNTHDNRVQFYLICLLIPISLVFRMVVKDWLLAEIIAVGKLLITNNVDGVIH